MTTVATAPGAAVHAAASALTCCPTWRDAKAEAAKAIDAALPHLREAWETEHCIHNYPGDKHYPHDGPHELYEKPQSVVEQEESTLRGALGLARARYESLIIAVDEAERHGRSIDTPIRRRRPPAKPDGARGGA